MDIKQATQSYEAWLGRRMPLIEADLGLKHQRMAEGPFPFLRATFYRWTQLWPEACAELAAAPRVLGVGDLHVENFGTWRDHEGRLVWGINDFDEACSLPYTNDLVRLAVSASLAVDANRLSSDPNTASDAILAGNRDALVKGGQPFVLAEGHRWLRDLAMSDLRNPVQYWDKLGRWPAPGKAAPPDIQKALQRALPEAGLVFRVIHRQAGLGSLGRRRFTALAEWRGGMIAREAKQLTRSAWTLEKGDRSGGAIHYGAVLAQAVRVMDPYVGLHNRWVIRRLAPDCSRIDLGSLPRTKDAVKLFYAMGWETANIHLGTQGAARRVLDDLKRRPDKWLRSAVKTMVKAVLNDWQEWVKNHRAR